jgi:hypothetical protein
MKLLKLFTLALAAAAASSALGWNYTVHNNTPYHLITSFIRIAGLFDNPVVMTPNSTSNVRSWVGPIDYCYSGFHLLIQPLPGQQVPQVMFNGKAAAITAGKMPDVNAIKELSMNISDALLGTGGAAAGGALGAGVGTTIGAAESLVFDALTAGAGTFFIPIFMAAGGAVGAEVGTVVGGAIGATALKLGQLKSITDNQVAYNAPWIPIPGDACWNKTITLYYNQSNNQIIVTVE